MNYIINYEIGSLLFLLVTISYYFTQKQLPLRKNKIFGMFMLGCLVNIILDIVTVLAESNNKFFTISWLYTINISYLCISNILVALSFYYIFTITSSGEKRNVLLIKLLFLFPIITAVAFIVTTPLTGFIFTIMPNKIYARGNLYPLLYISSIFYMVSIAIRAFLRTSYVEKKITISTIAFVVIMTSFSLTQFFHPRYLILGMASVLSVNIFFHSNQTAGDHIDITTKLFNRTALPMLINNLFTKNSNFQIIIFAFKDFSSISLNLGINSSSILLTQITQYLQSEYPCSYILHTSDDTFIVISTKIYNQNELAVIISRFPKIWNIDDIEIVINTNIITLYSYDYDDTREILTIIDYANSAAVEKNSSLIVADRSFKENYHSSLKTRTILNKALKENSISLSYYPIHRIDDNSIFAAEIHMVLYDEDMEAIQPEAFMKIAEDNGAIVPLGVQAFDKVCCFLHNNDIRKLGIDHININLSVLQCMQEDLSEQIIKALNKYAVSPSLICFEITESATISSVKTLECNMNRLSSLGITFSIDDYGTGYSNLEHIMSLPIKYVKFDKQIVSTAITQNGKEAFFKGLVAMFTRINIAVIAQGVKNSQQASSLCQMGVKYAQAYNSPPLTAQEFIKYAGENCHGKKQ